MPSKKFVSKKEQITTTNTLTAEDIAHLFKSKGLKNTAKWIEFSLNSKLPSSKDIIDIINSLRIEIRTYKREYYEDSTFRENCFNVIWKTIILGMSVGQKKFYALTSELIPVIEKTIQTNELLEDIILSAETLEHKPKFYLICFYYLMLMEGSFKNVMKNVMALKRLHEGKDVKISETLGLRTDNEIENENNMKELLPEKLKNPTHRHLRNAIAHANFQYLDDENKMKFWDINTKNQNYSMRPIRLTYSEFIPFLLEINFFCEILGFIMLLLIAAEDIIQRRS